VTQPPSGPGSPTDGSFVDDAHRYSLTSRIATGGMGEVWRARDTVLGREVAVKLLKTEYADHPTFRSRFETEARHAASLLHPGVAAVYDFGEASPADGSGVGRPYLVMELVDGQPLSALLAGGRPLDPDVTRDLLAQAADAIGAAHAAGIVHRDVKPANLLVTPDRHVKITDFGIARATEGMALTETGQVMGTPQYLSPEQAQGGTATPASDVYSLGVVAFECLAGRRPYVAETAVATALAHLREPVPDLPDDVPADLAAVVKRSMAKSPEDRFPDASAFAAALRDPSSVPPLAAAGATTAGSGGSADSTQVLTGVPPVVPPPSSSTPVARDEDRRRTVPWGWILLALAVIAALVLVAVLASGGEDDPAPTDPTRSAPTKKSSEPAPSSTEEAGITIDESDYVGRDIHDVEAELRSLGLKVAKDKLDNDGSHEQDIVASVSPSGTLQEGDTVTVGYWGKAPKEEPTPTPTETTSPTPTETTSPSPTETTTSASSTTSSSPSAAPSGSAAASDTTTASSTTAAEASQ